MAINTYMQTVGRQARTASRAVAAASTDAKNKALLAMAAEIRARQAALSAANQRDLDEARANGLEAAMIDRLTLSAKGIEAMAVGLEQVAALPDPVGEMTDLKRRPSGITVGKMRVPLGVIGIIYEARPNVTADAAALCLKSGNAAILRGGKEALHSNRAIADCVRAGLAAAGLPELAIQVIDTTDRAAVGELIAMPEFVDVIVPRGGKSLIERISRDARVPVIKHLDGNCHVFVDEFADTAKALAIVENAKTQRYGTCNTTESLLAGEPLARRFASRSVRATGAAQGVRLKVRPFGLLAESDRRLDLVIEVGNKITAVVQVVPDQDAQPGHLRIIVLAEAMNTDAPELAVRVVSILPENNPAVLVKVEGAFAVDVLLASLECRLDHPDAVQFITHQVALDRVLVDDVGVL